MFDQIKNQWEAWSFVKKALLIVCSGLLFLGLALGAYWVMHDDYQVLFADLHAQDASAMVAELDRLKVPYRLAENGSTILVEQDMVYKTRLKLMGKGLNLNGAVGFEIFNNSEFGMTEFSQKVNYQRALQGELARTIMGFEEIKSARVHLVLPESGLFKRQNAKPKASVSVLVKDGNILNSEQVSGIQRLVAASVPEISSAEVTVVDQRGVALTKPLTGQDADGALQERLEMKKQLEEYMTRKVLNVVDRAVGPGKAIVSVDVALNYDQIKVTKEDVVPLHDTTGQDVGAVVRRKESMQASDSGEVTSNQSSLIKPSSTSTETEFINSRRVEQVLSSQGNILHLSVGVLVPNTSDQIKLAKLKEVISMVVGINADRGDGLAVYSVDIPQVTDTEGQEAITPNGGEISHHDKREAANDAQSLPIASYKNLSIFGGILALVMFVYVALLKSSHAKKKKLSQFQKDKILAEISKWAGNAKSI